MTYYTKGDFKELKRGTRKEKKCGLIIISMGIFVLLIPKLLNIKFMKSYKGENHIQIK